MSIKVQLTPAKDVVKVSKRFARIKDIDEWGRVVYEVRLWADVVNAVVRDAVKVKVSVYSTNPVVKHRLFSGVKTSFDMIRAIQQQSSRMKDKRKKHRKSPLAYRNLDISAGLDNSKVLMIKKFPARANKILGTKRIFQAIRAGSLKKSPRLVTPNMSISMVRPEYHVKNRSPRLSAIRSILRDGVDPSAVGNFKFPLITSRESNLGTQGPAAKKGRCHRNRALNVQRSTGLIGSVRRSSRRRQHIPLPPPRSMLAGKQIAGIMSSFQRDNNTINKLAPQGLKHRTRTIQRRIPKRWIRLESVVPINKWRLGSANRLYFLFELFGPNGEVVDQEVRVVNHDSKLKQYFTPKRSPIIKVIGAKIGTNRLAVRQIDPIAVKVAIYRKFLIPSSPSIAQNYKLIATLDVTTDEGYVSYRDTVNNHTTCIYRAVAVGPRDAYGRTFRNVIARALPYPSWRVKLQKDLDHVSIFAQTTDSGTVRIRVANIPEGPCALYVLATNMSSPCPTRPHHGHCRLVGADPNEQIQVISQGTSEIFFEDSQVRTGQIYEYHCRLIYPDGREDPSTVTVIHEFIEDFQNENIVITPGNPRVNIEDNGSISVSFDVFGAFTEGGFNSIIAAVGGAGINSEYMSEIQENRSELNSLIAFEILRQDNISGETETFSVVQNETMFVDNATLRSQTGVSDLQAGRSYRYIIVACARDPGTLFTQTLESSTDETTDANYQMRVFKYLNPLTLKTGTLPSTGRARGKTKVSGLVSQNPFLQGKTSINIAVDVTVPSQRSNITDLSAAKISDDEVIVKWSVVGSTEEVDHFLIMAEMDGVKSALDTVHAISDASDYEYVEDDLAAEVGTVGYSIIPVFADYTYGAETDTVYATNENDHPEVVEAEAGFGIST